jgi:CYTH domain-containing protein
VKPEHLEAIGALESTAIKVSEIQQGYLCLGLDEARVRRKGDAYLLTLKSAGGLTRREVEISLSPAQFETLWPLTEGQRLEKVRSVAEVSESHGTSARIEIDRFRGVHAPLVLIECEFVSAEAAQGFKAPAFFGEEVTDDPHFKNRSLATRDQAAPSLADVDLPNGR